MAFSQRVSSSHWVVHLQSPSKSVIKVEVHMSPEEAKRLTTPEELRRTVEKPEDLGAAVLHRLTTP